MSRVLHRWIPAALVVAFLTGQAGCWVDRAPGIEEEFAFTAKLGEPIKLPADATEVKVAATRVVDPLRASTRLPAHERLVGVQLAVENKGDQGYRDVPIARLITASGKWLAPAQAVKAGGCSQTFVSPLTLASGSEETVCVPFALERSEELQRFRIAFQREADRGSRRDRGRGGARRLVRGRHGLSRRPRPDKSKVRFGEWTLPS